MRRIHDIRQYCFTRMFALLIIAMLFFSSLAHSLLMKNLTISSSGTIAYSTAKIGWLHTDGRYIKDENGNTVILRGFNKQDFLDFPDGSWPMEGERTWGGQGRFRDDAVRQHMRHWRDFWKINLVRFHLNIRAWRDNVKTSPYTGTESNIGCRDAIVRTIQIAYEEGMYIEIDFYQTDFGESQRELPWPTTVIPDKTAFVNFWINVSATLDTFPNVIYELWNEPAGSRSDWFDAATQTINAIRSRGDNHLILIQWRYGGEVNYVYEWEKEGRPTQNIVFGIHNYRSLGSFESNSNSPTDYEYIRNYLWRSNGAPMNVTYPNTGTGMGNRYRYPPTGANYGEVLTELNGGKGYPLWIGEFAGVYMATNDAEYTYFVNTLRVFKEWGVGWAFYVWDGLGGSRYMAQQLTGIAFQPPNRGGQAMIDSLASP